jgi:hypothetical protein
VKGTPVRQVVRQPEPEPEDFSNEEKMESDKEIVHNKISELVDEVSLILTSKGRFLAFPSVFYAY